MDFLAFHVNLLVFFLQSAMSYANCEVVLSISEAQRMLIESRQKSQVISLERNDINISCYGR